MAVLPSGVSRSSNLIYGIRLTYDRSYEYRYVGKTIHGTDRLRAHIRVSNNPKDPSYNHPKSRWIRKHFSNVTFDVLEECEDVRTLDDLERKWIHILRNKGHNLLNCTDGGDGRSGWSMSEDQKRLISTNMSGENHWAHGGGKFSEEHRKNLSLASSGENNWMYGRKGDECPSYGQTWMQGAGNPMAGRNHTDASRLKMSLAVKKAGYVPTPEVRENASKVAKLNMHKRWHVSRGIVKEECIHCRKDL